MTIVGSSRFWSAVSILVGATVGVGVFGMPLAFYKAGFGVGFLFFVVIVGVMTCTNLLYGEIVLRTHNRHQFVGYIKVYLGPIARRIATFNFWLAVFGSILGILIINGQFASDLLRLVFGLSVSSVWLSILFFTVGLVLALRGLRTVARFDLIMLVSFFAIVLAIILVSIKDLSLSNISFANDPYYWYLPFGVLLFSLNGIQGVPLARELLVGRERLFKKALVIGTLIPAILYLLFTMAVVGVAGDMVTPTALSGLETHLGRWIVIIGTLFGFLSSITIFLSMVVAFQESLWQDFRLRSKKIFLAIMALPLLMFILGIRDFVSVIGLVGGVAVSLDTIMLIVMYLKAKKIGNRVPEYSLRLAPGVLYTIGICFLLGSVYTFLVK